MNMSKNMSRMAAAMEAAPKPEGLFEDREMVRAREVLGESKRRHWQTVAEARVRGNPLLIFPLIIGVKIFLREEVIFSGRPGTKVRVDMFWCFEHNGVAAGYPQGYEKGGFRRRYRFCLVCEQKRILDFEAKQKVAQIPVGLDKRPRTF